MTKLLRFDTPEASIEEAARNQAIRGTPTETRSQPSCTRSREVPPSQLSSAPHFALAQTNYCSLPNFGRSEQEHEHKGNENKSAKYGLTNFKDQNKLHLRPCAGKLLTENQTVRELIKGGVPWLPNHGRFGPIVI